AGPIRPSNSGRWEPSRLICARIWPLAKICVGRLCKTDLHSGGKPMHRLHAFMRCALVTAAIAIPSASLAQVLITVAPPPLVVYEQPPLPGPGYIWTPGYWAYGPDGYFWVPGTWVEPPSVGLLWTPGYWGWRNGSYLWNAGYWGPTVGYYGGINYGYGY